MNTKLSYVNNWEADEYYVNDQLVLSLSKVRIGDKHYNVKSKRISVSYSDMGHYYEGTSTHYFVEDSFGVLVEIKEIMQKHSVFAEEYKLRK